MFENVDAALSYAYKLAMLRIEPQNNTAQIMDWCRTKGVRRGGGKLSQHEHHANSAMIISRTERVLNRYELAAVELHYTGGQKADGIVDLTAWIERENNGVNLLLCDALLGHLFFRRPKRTAIMDKYDLSCGSFYRQFNKIRRIHAALLNSAWLKLQDGFEQASIIQRHNETI